MSTQSRKQIRDLRLKIAIIEARKTQRRVALETRIGEVRLSALVRGHGAPATRIEQLRLAKCLGRTREDLFAPELIADSDQDAATDAAVDVPALRPA
jgi:hypothetical protein